MDRGREDASGRVKRNKSINIQSNFYVFIHSLCSAMVNGRRRPVSCNVLMSKEKQRVVHQRRLIEQNYVAPTVIAGRLSTLDRLEDFPLASEDYVVGMDNNDEQKAG